MYWPEENNPNADRLLELSREPDERARLLGWYLTLLGLLLIGSFIFATTLRERANSMQIENDIKLLSIYAQQLNRIGQVDAWAAQVTLPAAYSLLISDPGGDVRYTTLQDTTSNSTLHLTQRDKFEWITQVSRTARYSTSPSFTSIDPSGRMWLHTWVVTSAEGKLVLQRPFVQDGIFPLWVYYIPVLIVGLALVGGLALWYQMSERWVGSIDRLIDMSETIRWRGFLQPGEREEFQKLAEEGGRVGRLASSLTAMEQETQTRLLQLSTLLETGRSVTATLDVDQVMDNILVQVQQLFGAERCAILTLDARVDAFRIRASRGLSDSYVSQLRIATSEPNSPSMRALRNRQSIQVVDMEIDLSYEPFRKRARVEGNRSVLAIPLATVHASQAVLLVYKSSPYRYSYSELELANLVGTHAALALENAALFASTDEQLQEQTRRLDAIVESLNDGLVLENLAGDVTYSNRRAARLVGLRRSQMKLLSVTRLLELLLANAEDPAVFWARMHSEAADANGHYTIDLTRVEANGQPQDLRINFFTVTDAHGQLLGRGQLWQDMTSDKELDRMKSSLISTVSHELRTPLATIKGYATTLLAPDVQWDEASQREFLETISSEADRLADLVQDLLDMSRIEAGTLEINYESYSLNQLVPEVLQTFPDGLNGRVHLALADSLPAAAMDLSRIRTVLRNLLENAVKYSESKTRIEVKTFRQNGDVVCLVRDHGIGIPLDMPYDIFERFVRLDNRLARKTGGFGLGLAICKGFVEAHSGEIWLQREEQGATFGFSLPVEEE